MRDVFRRADLEEAREDLRVCEAGVAEDGAAGLEGLDDLVGGVAGEGEAGGGGVDLHGAPEGLLGAGCHAVGGELSGMGTRDGGERLPVRFIEDDELLPPGR